MKFKDILLIKDGFMLRLIFIVIQLFLSFWPHGGSFQANLVNLLGY